MLQLASLDMLHLAIPLLAISFLALVGLLSSAALAHLHGLEGLLRTKATVLLTAAAEIAAAVLQGFTIHTG